MRTVLTFVLGVVVVHGFGQLNLPVKEQDERMAPKQPHGTYLDVMARPPAQASMDSVGTARSTIYLSAWGHGFLYSVNFDRAWRVGNGRMSLSIGGAYLPDVGERRSSGPILRSYSLPVQWNYFHGKRSTMEHGCGLSLLSGWNAVSGTIDASGPVHSTALYAFIKPVAYRLQPMRRGLFLRVHVLVALKLIEFNEGWKRYVEKYPDRERQVFPWPGVDVGYSF